MAAITRKEIEELKDTLFFKKTQKLNNKSVAEFLHLFEEGEPLQLEAIVDWQELPPIGVQADFIRKCFEQALKEGFIEDRNDEFFITAAGREKAEEAKPDDLNEG